MKLITSVFLMSSLIGISACGKHDLKIGGTYKFIKGVENCTLIDLQTLQIDSTNLLIKGGGNKDSIRRLGAEAKASGGSLEEDAFFGLTSTNGMFASGYGGKIMKVDIKESNEMWKDWDDQSSTPNERLFTKKYKITMENGKEKTIYTDEKDLVGIAEPAKCIFKK
jgi:hypothetical protein